MNVSGGRSGVYLAIDANIELAEEEDSFYVFGYLKKLRQSRKGLIENVDQYKFVYDTLEEYVVCGNSFFPVKELSQKLKQKSIKDPAKKLNEYQKEYAQICKQTPRFSIGDCAGGHRGDNREKNRDVLCVPRKMTIKAFPGALTNEGFLLGNESLIVFFYYNIYNKFMKAQMLMKA